MIHGLKLGIFPASKLRLHQPGRRNRENGPWVDKSYCFLQLIKMLSVGKWLLRTSFIFTCRTSTGPPSVLLTGFPLAVEGGEGTPFPNFCRWEHDLRINFRTSVWTVRKRHVLLTPGVWEDGMPVKTVGDFACLPAWMHEWYTRSHDECHLTTFFFNCSAWLVGS